MHSKNEFTTCDYMVGEIYAEVADEVTGVRPYVGFGRRVSGWARSFSVIEESSR